MGTFNYFQQSIKNFLFKDQEQSFNLHASPINNIMLLVIRIVSFIVLNLSLIWALMRNPGSIIFFTELTYLGFFFTICYFDCVIFDYFLNYRRILQEKQQLSKGLKYWAETFGELGLSYEMAITILYWIVLFPDALRNTPYQIAQSSNIHSFPIICLLADFLFNSLGFSIRRFLIIVLISIAYLIINAVYSLTYKPVYEVVTWKSVYSYILIGVALGIIYFFFFVGNIISYCIKQRFMGISLKQKQQILQMMPIQTS